MRKFLIDTDTASDDAVALILALSAHRAGDIVVKGITTVSGNVDVERATRNALLTTSRCGGNDVPVYRGTSRPLLRQPASADWFHGADGMGDMNYPDASRAAESARATDALIQLISENPGIELVTLGPLTNVALALAIDPTLARNVSRCVVMGGNPCCVGNVTPTAEYNIWCDPEAAAIVFGSGLPIEMVGWQLSRFDAVLNADDIAAIRTLDTPLAHLALDCNRVAANAYQTQTGEVGIALPDPVAMAVALDPANVIKSSSRHRVEIECHSELTRGMTVVDQLNVSGDARNRGTWKSTSATGGRDNHNGATIVWQIDVPRWKKMLFDALRFSPG